jgi:hypothetical protein
MDSRSRGGHKRLNLELLLGRTIVEVELHA